MSSCVWEGSLILFNLPKETVTEDITKVLDSFSVPFHNFRDDTLIYPAAECRKQTDTTRLV